MRLFLASGLSVLNECSTADELFLVRLTRAYTIEITGFNCFCRVVQPLQTEGFVRTEEILSESGSSREEIVGSLC